MKKNAFLQDFKAFALKGNVLDMAVGVIIGGAFGKIVSSLVADIIMPPIGLLVGGVNFTDLKWVMKPAVVENGKEVAAAVTLNYGNFLQVTFDFLIIAFSIFMFIKLLTQLTTRKKNGNPCGSSSPSCPQPRGRVAGRNTGFAEKQMKRKPFKPFPANRNDFSCAFLFAKHHYSI